MILENPGTLGFVWGVPRVGGGDPDEGKAVISLLSCSPRRRG